MQSCLYILREPSTGLESSLFDSREAGSVLIEGALPASSNSFAAQIPKGGEKESLPPSPLTDVELLELVFVHTKVILL